MQVKTSAPKTTLEQQTTSEANCSTRQNNKRYIQIKSQREKIFFTPVADTYAKKEVVIKLNNNNQDFYDKLNMASKRKLVEIFSDLIRDLQKFDRYYCNSSHTQKIDTLFIKMAYQTTIDEDIKLRFKNICYWLYKLINLLKDFQYQHNLTRLFSQSTSHNEYLPENINISKEAIALRLQECFAHLDSCWDGIGSRFAHEYEILSSMQQGLTGQIFLIKKSLFQTLVRQFIDTLRQEKKYDADVSMEIHLYNLLHNTTAQQLGFFNIIDNFIPKNFPDHLMTEFKELATIEVSPANISRILAENLYEKIVNCLTKINLQDWLYTPKKDTDFCAGLNILLEISVFAPTNALFNVDLKQKLDINTIVDYTENKDGELLYSLNKVQEKLHFWIANSLMPNTETILVTNIYNQQTQSYVSIASIDYMFFWVVEQDQYENNVPKYEFNADNYITLDLSYIQQLDFITFPDIDINKHLDFYCHYKKTEISIALASQALYQTNNAMIIVHFFTDYTVNSMLEKSPLIYKILHKVLKDKLADSEFIKHFIKEVINYYAHNFITKITKNEASFFIKYKIFADIFPEIIKQNININECFDLNADEIIIALQQINNLSINKLKTIFNHEINNVKILKLLIKNNSSKLIYSMLISDTYSLDLINDNYNDILLVAVNNYYDELIDFLLKFKHKNK